MIWVLVITLILSAPEGGVTNVEGAVGAHPSERVCNQHKQAAIDFHASQKRPNLTLSVGCTALTLPGVV